MMVDELIAIMREEHRRPHGDFFHGVDLEAYANKLLRQAEVVVHYRGGRILGLAACYCNDVDTWTGFLSLLWVSPNARGAGIALGLLAEVISVLETRRFRYLKLDVLVDNKRAINFYRRQGFEVIGKKPGSLVMRVALPRSRGCPVEDGCRQAAGDRAGK